MTRGGIVTLQGHTKGVDAASVQGIFGDGAVIVQVDRIPPHLSMATRWPPASIAGHVLVRWRTRRGSPSQ